MCFEQGKIPVDWKDSNVTCIFKKGDKTDPGNYRPVSLTCILSEVAESFIKEYVYNYLESTQYLCEAQHGFRSHRSCTTQLILVADILLKIIEEGLDTDIVYLDLKKAFDKVPHMRLLISYVQQVFRAVSMILYMIFLVTENTELMLLSLYHQNLQLRVGSNKEVSWVHCCLYFFINDIPSNIVNHCMVFADDTKLFGNPGLNLQLDVETTFQWAQTWQINFNIAKCKIIHFSTSQDNNYDYYMTDHNIRSSIAYTTNEKDIGVTFDTNLGFNTHITTTVRKCQGILSVIKRSFTYYIDETVLIFLYITLVRPILEYSSVVWAPHLRKHINILEAVQRRATRMIPNLKDMSYLDRLEKLNLFSLAYRRRRGDLIQVFKLLHSIDNVNYTHLFELNPSITRGHDLKLKKNSAGPTVENFHSRSESLYNDWNSLPPAVVHAKNLNTFKKELDIFFKDYTHDF